MFLLIFILLLILYQDLKEREVTLLFFLLGIIIGGFLYFKETSMRLFGINLAINLLILSFVSLSLFLYSRFCLKKKILEAIGMGDFLFFILLSFSFPTATFLVLLSFSLFFSLILFLLLKSLLTIKTVPLAGFQALFLSIVLILNKMFNFVDLYLI
ncbi:hypothetical protein [Tenacibaculum maritimum]|nr:hypothetical protein [Tenacibaculum maritimum]